MTREELNKLIMQACERTWNEKTCKEIEQTLSQEPCTDAVSREWLKKKLQEHHDFFVNAYGGFKNMPQTDKARVDEITQCIAEVVNAPSVNPQPCGDVVRRSGAIKAIEKKAKQIKNEDTLNGLAGAVAILFEIPPVTQKSGKWIKVKSGDKDFPESIVCSRCSNENSHLDFNENAEPIGKVFVTSKFCPNCGAKMESEG